MDFQVEQLRKPDFRISYNARRACLRPCSKENFTATTYGCRYLFAKDNIFDDYNDTETKQIQIREVKSKFIFKLSQIQKV